MHGLFWCKINIFHLYIILMQLVVPSAVRNAVSAATTIFTANSIHLFFSMIIFIFSFFDFTEDAHVRHSSNEFDLCTRSIASFIFSFFIRLRPKARTL